MRVRLVIVALLVLAGSFVHVSQPEPTQASYTDSAVPAALYASTTGCCVYSVTARMSTPNPTFNSGQQWSHNVVGAVGTYSVSNTYSETGTQKNINGFRYPYWNVYANGTRTHYGVTNLGNSWEPGRYEQFTTQQFAGGSMYWRAAWGGSSIGPFQVHVATTGFRWMISGLEASCNGCAMGYTDIQGNRYDSGNGNWVNWCYSSSPNYWGQKGTFTNPQPTKSPCYGANNNSWNILYH